MNISLAAITELRNKTGAGLLMTKNALVEANGDPEKALTILRQKGVSLADGRSSRSTFEGVIDSYIHVGNKMGVMIEVACETDFVARNEEFRQFVRDLCLQIAAGKPAYIDRKEIPDSVVQAEIQIYKSGLESKPVAAQEKIIAGKMEKYYSSVCLLDQAFVKDTSKTVKDLLDEQRLCTKENVVIKRFARFEVGDGLK